MVGFLLNRNPIIGNVGTLWHRILVMFQNLCIHGFSTGMGTQTPHAGPCNEFVRLCRIPFFHLMPIPILSELVCYKFRRNGIGQFLIAGPSGRSVLDPHIGTNGLPYPQAVFALQVATSWAFAFRTTVQCVRNLEFE